jgi:hypothetical protein
MVTASWPRVWKGQSHELERNEGVVPGKVKETGPHQGGAVAFSDAGRCFGG